MEKVTCYTITELRDHCSPRAYEKALNWLTEGVCDFFVSGIQDYDCLYPETDHKTLKKRMLKAGILPKNIQQIFRNAEGEALFSINPIAWDIDRGSFAQFEFQEWGKDLNTGKMRRFNYSPDAELIFAELDLNPKVWKYADYIVVQKRDYGTGILLIYNSDEHGDFDDLPKYIQQDILKYLPTYNYVYSEKKEEVPFDSSDSNADCEYLDFTFSEKLLKAIRDSYEYQTSESTLIEDSEANGYLYDEEGDPVHHLMSKEYVLFSEKEEVQS